VGRRCDLQADNEGENPNAAQCYLYISCVLIQGGSNMTGTNCDLFTHNQSRSYLNHLVF
jgi:hypothetical protein